MSTAITFEQIEHRTERTILVATLGKLIGKMALAILPGILVSRVDRITGELTSEFLSAIAKDDAYELRALLQELHSNLIRLLRHAGELRCFGRDWIALEDRTDVLGDIIEDITLQHDESFHSLINNCAENLQLQ